MSTAITKVGGGCIEWTGCKNANGYGVVRHRGAARLAHRVAWMNAHGEIPEGLCVCHRCDNPACVNVDHLFLGTQTDNVRDMDAKGRRFNAPVIGEQHANSRLTEDDVREIRFLRSVGAGQQEIADVFGVSQVTVSVILRGKTWRHVS